MDTITQKFVVDIAFVCAAAFGIGLGIAAAAGGLILLFGG